MEKMCRRCQLATLEVLTWIDFDMDTGCWHLLPQAPAGAETGARYTAWTAWRCGSLLENVVIAGKPAMCVMLNDCLNPEHYYSLMQFRSRDFAYVLPVGF